MNTEKNEISLLLDRGAKFKIGRFKFIVYACYAYTMDRIADISIDIVPVNEDELALDPLGTCRKTIRNNAKKLAKVIAIAVLRDKWKMMFLPVLWRYFYNNLTPAVMVDMIQVVNSMNDYQNFLNSTRLMCTRTTTPNRVEKTIEV